MAGPAAKRLDRWTHSIVDCRLIGFSDNRFLEKEYDDHCTPYLKGLHEKYEKLINNRAREKKSTACARIQLTEAKWYRNARDFASALRKYAELDRDLHSEAAQNKGLAQDVDGSVGFSADNWFLKLDYTKGIFFKAHYAKGDDRNLKIYPSFLDEINSPQKLRAMFNKYLLPLDEKYRKRDEHALNSLTGMVALLFMDMPPGYKFHPKLKEEMQKILNEWQNPATGFWGKTTIIKGKKVFIPHLSMTFHIVNFREENAEAPPVNRWPQIIDTLLSVKDKEWPEGWLEDGKFTYHHHYDVMKLFRLGWNFASPVQKKKMFVEIKNMIEKGAWDIMRDNYNFDDSDGTEIEESIAYHVFFLEETHIFEDEVFWREAGNIDLPKPYDLAERLNKKIAKDFNHGANMELKRALDVTKRWLRKYP